MDIIYAREPFPDRVTATIFLAGPTPRSRAVPSWRPAAVEYLQARGFSGTVFVPENRDDPSLDDAEQGDLYERQVIWETVGLNRADIIVFWVPRKLDVLPAFTTNVEFGEWYRSGKVVFGAPEDAAKVGYLKRKATSVLVPTHTSLEATLDTALRILDQGAERTGGECQVPLFVWNTDSFQKWYRGHRLVGNRLESARVEYTFRVGQNRERVFLWILHANMFIFAEGRNKTNEIVIGRPDVSATILYRLGKTRGDTEVVLVREFRSPSSTGDGFIRELPSGSSPHRMEPTLVAAEEVREETGLIIDPRRIHYHGQKQVAGTFSPYSAHLCSYKLTEPEYRMMKGEVGKPRGDLVGTGELTTVEIWKLRDIVLAEGIADWSTIGMILSVLMT